ncbi:MAG: hypothetical protein OXC72_14645 [Roseovarius sp.]|nr:hypothetical protein [Roseovarius sp.]
MSTQPLETLSIAVRATLALDVIKGGFAAFIPCCFHECGYMDRLRNACEERRRLPWNLDEWLPWQMSGERKLSLQVPPRAGARLNAAISDATSALPK